MSHLDEGTMTALLDNELSHHDRQQAEQHLASCGECRQLFEEVRGFAGEADQLVDSVQPSERIRQKPGGSTSARWDRLRPLAWAATLVVAAGLGWSASGLRLKEADSDVPAAGLAEQKVPADSTAAPGAGVDAFRPLQEARERAAPRQDQELRRQATEPPAPAATDMAKTADVASTEADMTGNADGRAEASAKGTLPAAALAAQSGQAPAAEPPGPRDIARRTNLYRVVSLEQAVRILGGTVKLIDGLTPTAVGIRPPQLAGEDPGLEVVRITYLDPPGRELWLDQQRSPVPGEGGATPPALAGMLAGDTLITSAGEGLTRVRWISMDGFRLTLTGHLPGDSLRILARRVH